MRSSTGTDRPARKIFRLVLTRPPLTRSNETTAAPGKIGSSSFATAARSSAISALSRSQRCLMPEPRASDRSMAAASECRRVRQAANPRALEHRQLPMAVSIVDAQDVSGAVVALDLDVAVIRPEPLIERLDDADPRSAQTKALRHRHVVVSGVGVDANLHAKLPRDHGRRGGRTPFKHSAGLAPTRHSGADGRIALNRSRRPPTTRAEQARRVVARQMGEESMFIGCNPPRRAAKLVVAGSMLALAASLAWAQQPQPPAPAAPAAPAPGAPVPPAPAPAAQGAPAIVPPVPASTPQQEPPRPPD